MKGGARECRSTQTEPANAQRFRFDARTDCASQAPSSSWSVKHSPAFGSIPVTCCWPDLHRARQMTASVVMTLLKCQAQLSEAELQIKTLSKECLNSRAVSKVTAKPRCLGNLERTLADDRVLARKGVTLCATCCNTACLSIGLYRGVMLCPL